MDDPALPACPDSHYTTTQTTAATTTTTTTAATTTTTTTAQSPPISVDLAYLKSVPGILRIVEIVVSLIYFILLEVCANSVIYCGISGMTSVVFTGSMFFVFLLKLDKRLANINWITTDLVYNLVWTVNHFIAACIVANRASVFSDFPPNFLKTIGVSHFGTALAAVVGFGLMILYGVSTFFSGRAFQEYTRRLRAVATSTTAATVTSGNLPAQECDAPPAYDAGPVPPK